MSKESPIEIQHGENSLEICIRKEYVSKLRSMLEALEQENYQGPIVSTGQETLILNIK